MHASTPHRHRSHQLVRGGFALAIALLLALAGGFVPVRAAPRASTTAAPTPCRAADLDAAISHQGVTDTTLIHVGITTVRPDIECTLMGQPQVQLFDARGNLLVESPPPDPSAGQPVVLSAGVGASASVRWSNWCGPQGATVALPPIGGPIAVIVILPGDAGQLVAHPRGTVAEAGPLGGGPPCLGTDQPSQLFPVKPFEAAPGTSFGAPGSLPIYVAAPFFAYWRAHGGLAFLGYPLSREVEARSGDGKTYTVQYFERARLEYHPENAAPNAVLLGQLGREVHPADPPVQARNDPFFTYFPETGHNVEKRFLGPWGRGGLAQFGYPISEPSTERLEDGKDYTVQYFERARFEWHLENADPAARVLLGQLGRRLYTAGAEPPVGQSPASGYCPETQGAAATVRVRSDTPSPRCQKVRSGQHLRIINNTAQPVRARLAQIDVTIAPGGEWADDRPFGTYLAPGVHVLALSAYAGGGAELWVQR